MKITYTRKEFRQSNMQAYLFVEILSPFSILVFGTPEISSVAADKKLKQLKPISNILQIFLICKGN